MALKVIGAGWGRTGTESLKKALEIIGFGKCYHAFELLKDGHRVVYWEQLAKGEQPDYDRLFEGFQSAVDFPVALYYKEFMKQYPEAKIILSYRDPEKWYESASKTILRPIPFFFIPLCRFVGLFNKNISYFPRIHAIMINEILNQFMQGRQNDRAFMINLYNRWVEDVKQTVPEEKLLVFEAREGWEPLCKFLNVPIPEVPYPKGNDSEQFRKRIKVSNFIKEFSNKGE
jgi:hypothetical protein